MKKEMPLDFTFLPDDVAEEDLFEDAPHKEIASKLYELITDEKIDGLTVGIEGKWGSGKSTVIKLLRKKCEEKDDIFIFYMDTWAHEGDHLRRIFLEEFITQAETTITTLSDKDKENLKDIKLRATNKRITKKIKRTQKTTIYGKIAAFFMLFIPLGSAIILKTISGVTINWKHPFHWEFLFGVGFLILPFIACFVWWVIQKIIHRKDNETTSVSFWESNSNEEYTNETSQEEERSSVEFSNFFQQVLKIIAKKEKPIVCVIDNLDRINVDDALKIWSTLQTFVQNKNPTNRKEEFKNLWILVPYDESGLSKIWDKSEQKHGNCTETGCARCFFDKCFQLRIEVPSLILSRWVNYTKKMLDEAFKDSKNINQDIIINILKGTRTKIDDIPNPREIKMYINQIGFLRSLLGTEISLEAIAIYCAEKYLGGKPNETIKEQLINKAIPEKSLFTRLNKPELPKEISAILFQVPKEKGMQILLQAPIETAILSTNTSNLKELEKQHRSVFWDVLDYLLQHETNKSAIYIHSLYTAFGNQEKDIQSLLLSYTLEKREDIISSISSMEIKELISLFSVAKKGTSSYSYFIKTYVTNVNEKIESIDTDVEVFSILDDIEKLIDVLQDNKIKFFDYSKIKYHNFQKIVSKINSNQFWISKYIDISKQLDVDIAEQIKPGVAVPTNLPKMIQIGCLAGFNNWETTILSIYKNFEWNKGIQNSNIFTIVNIQLIEALQYANLSDVNTTQIKKLIESVFFWNYVGDFVPHVDIRLKASFLLGKYVNTLDIQNIPSDTTYRLQQQELKKKHQNFDLTEPQVKTEQLRLNQLNMQREGYRMAKEIWKSHSPENAEYMFVLASQTKNYRFIEKLAKDPTNLLAGDIIEIVRKKV